MEAIAKRKSTRDFDPDKAVPEEIMDTIIKAGCQAPIGGKQEKLYGIVTQNLNCLHIIAGSQNV